jgi:heme exporter protein B
MTRALSQIALLTLKDLKIEARSRQTIGLVVVLGLLIVTVLGLGLGTKLVDPTTQKTSGTVAAAVLWVAYLFSGVLCFEKTMAVERNDGALAGLLLAPIDRGVIYLGKLLSNLALMFAVAAVITPVGVLFFAFDLKAALIGFLIVMGLSIVGFAAVGTLFAAVVSSSRLQGGLLAMVVFPITLPLVISSTKMMDRLFEGGGGLAGSAFAILIAFDLIFLVVSWVAFEWILEP